MAVRCGTVSTPTWTLRRQNSRAATPGNQSLAEAAPAAYESFDHVGSLPGQKRPAHLHRGNRSVFL